MRVLLEARLRAMVREGRRGQAVELLRQVFGEERAPVIAAAIIPDTQTVQETPGRPARTVPGESSDRKAPPQRDLFGD